MIYTTCVPVAHDDAHAMASSLKQALAVSRYAELRLDYMKPDRVVPFLESVKEHLGRVICTLRPRAEGGRFTGTETMRRSILIRISEYEPYLTDVEYSTLQSEPGLRLCAGSDIMVSWHDFNGTPSLPSLRNRMQKMAAHSDTVKMVVTARSSKDAANILGLYADRGDITLAAFAMGERGRFTRVCAMHLGCPFMYASLGKAVAPGQYSIKEVHSINGMI